MPTRLGKIYILILKYSCNMVDVKTIKKWLEFAEVDFDYVIGKLEAELLKKKAELPLARSGSIDYYHRKPTQKDIATEVSHKEFLVAELQAVIKALK